MIHDELVTEMTPGNLTFNSLTPIYQVPVDKWLVVTHYSWDSACCDAAYVVELVDGNTSVRIEIDPNGSTSPSETWPIGYAFSPGSTVALQPLGNVSNASFTMLGYLRN